MHPRDFFTLEQCLEATRRFAETWKDRGRIDGRKYQGVMVEWKVQDEMLSFHHTITGGESGGFNCIQWEAHKHAWAKDWWYGDKGLWRPATESEIRAVFEKKS